MKTKTYTVAVLAIACITDAAQAGMCFEPRTLTAFLSKPQAPFCVSRCEDYQINAYQADLERYIKRLRQYADDVDEYYKSAGQYIACMADLE